VYAAKKVQHLKGINRQSGAEDLLLRTKRKDYRNREGRKKSAQAKGRPPLGCRASK